MKKYRSEDYVSMENPAPGQSYRSEILRSEDNAKDLGGLFCVIVPGSEVPYHYHRERESLIIAISGEAIEIVEGEEIPVKSGDVLFIPPDEKHSLVNRSDRDFRYLEFFTHPPAGADFVLVE